MGDYADGYACNDDGQMRDERPPHVVTFAEQILGIEPELQTHNPFVLPGAEDTDIIGVIDDHDDAEIPYPHDHVRDIINEAFADVMGEGEWETSPLYVGIMSALSRDEDEMNDISKACHCMEVILQHKNKKYDNSATDPLRIYSKSEEPTYLSRIDEKLKRIKASLKLRKNDTYDMAGYNLLAVIDNGWNTPEEIRELLD